MSRRRFIETGASASICLLTPPDLCCAEPMTQLSLGCVTGAVRNELINDWNGMLRKLHEIGYSDLQFNDHIGPSDLGCRKALNDLGMRAVAGGGTLEKLDTSLPAIMEHSHLVDKEFVACYWPWYDDGRNKTLENYRRLATRFNSVGEDTRRNGLRFVFHHHYLEFLPIEVSSL